MAVLDRLPLPKTTPMATEFGIKSVKIETTDGREILIYIEDDTAFYRESVMQIGNKTLPVREVFVTGGQVLKKKKKLAS